MKNPPEDWTPESWEPEEEDTGERVAVNLEFRDALKAWQWYALWALLFLKIEATKYKPA